MDLPNFRYHPDPIKTKVVEASPKLCAVCKRARGFCYVGPIYCRGEEPRLCPWCIASGEAARVFDAKFVPSEGPERVSDPRRLDELVHRTPGFFFANTEGPWPAHCDDYCEAIGLNVTWDEILPIVTDVEADLGRIGRECGMSRDDIVSELRRGRESPFWVSIFRCLHCRQPRLVGDYE